MVPSVGMDPCVCTAHGDFVTLRLIRGGGRIGPVRGLSARR